MIRYPISETELRQRIDALAPKTARATSWLDDAAARTAKLRQKPSAAKPSTWSRIKPVYVRLQHGKCAYCERPLGQAAVAAVEQDVEHFRPKNAVKAWPTEKLITERPDLAALPPSKGKGPGYALLAYEPLNYAVACKTCNSALKGNFFPIAGTHDWKGDTPKNLHAQERPYLIFPLGDIDDDPESLIDFNGVLPVPAAPKSDAHRRARAEVTIAFFLLAGDRDDLMLTRAMALELAGSYLEKASRGPAAARKAALADARAWASADKPMAGCVRALIRTFERDPRHALKIVEAVRAYRRTKWP